MKTAARVSVCLSFDFDGLSSWIQLGSRNLAEVTRGEFGAVALPRILSMLKRQSVSATFFIPGHTAVAYSWLVRDIRDRGHEIGHHGWVHENPGELSRAEAHDVFARGLEALDRAAGVRPRGYRAPGGVFTEDTLELLVEHGLGYDSSCSASDLRPYYLRRGDRWSRTEPYVFGAPSDIVEMAFSWALDDFPHFEFVPGRNMGQSPPSAVREIWWEEFDYAYTHVPGAVVVICMHPEVIGRGHRLAMVEGLIEQMRARSGVSFETLGDFAARWRSANPCETWLASGSLHTGRPPDESARPS
jgi:peptidoglycan/xylan/chitin deacetylase (PgdA/CDA1 family)